MWREHLNAFSYTFTFFFSWLLTIIGLSLIYFLPYFLKRSFTFSLDDYSLSYFHYIVSGMLINIFLVSTVKSFVSRVEKARNHGIMEAVLTTPTRMITFIIGTYCERLLFFLAINCPFLLIGIYFIWPVLNNVNIGAIVIIFICAQILYFSIGLCLVNYIIVFERGEFLVHALFNLFRVFCNILFPVSILPSVFQDIANVIPVSYVFRSFRTALFNGTDPMLWHSIGILCISSFIGCVISLALLKVSIQRVRITGTLSRY